jgi:hypothetical protein
MAISPIEFLKNLKPTKAVEEFFGVSFGISKRNNAQLIQNGFWHVNFFAHQFSWLEDYSNWIGVRIVPGVSLEESPIVSVNKFGAMTISPNLKNLTVNWLYYTQIDANNWEFIHQEWLSVKNEILEIHSQLGGDMDLFTRFDAYILNAENFHLPGYMNEITRAHEFLKVDQSVETTRFREFMQKLILNENLLPEFSNNFGAWNDYTRAAIASRAYFLRGSKKKSLVDTVQSMWLGFDKPAPYDSDIFGKIKQFGISRNPTLPLHSIALSTTQPYTHLNEPPIPDSIQNDPLFPAAQALASFSHASGYKGVEHMEAAAKLDIDLNDGKRSYEALVSASFWSAMNLGFPFKESYQAALHLAAKYGWDEMLELLEMNEFELQG